MGKAGNATEAERIARTLSYEYQRERALAAIAQAQAAAGNATEAERIAGTITDEDRRADALAAIAQAHATAGKPTEARHFAAEAERIAAQMLSTDTWPLALTPLLKSLQTNATVSAVDGWLTTGFITELIDREGTAEASVDSPNEVNSHRSPTTGRAMGPSLIAAAHRPTGSR